MRIHEQLAQKKDEIQAYSEGLDALVAYLSLQKFWCGNELDGYVNISDVVNRISDIRQNVTDAQVYAGMRRAA